MSENRDLMMGGNKYVPPFRWHQAAGDSSDGPPAEDTPTKDSSQSALHSDNRQGNLGYGRRGGGGYASGLYSPREIYNYFWGSTDGTRAEHNPTFHGSKDRPEKLSYVLLFYRAHPRWDNENIVFVKANLALLPDYAVRKAENGEGSAAKKLDENVPNSRDATVVHNEPGGETEPKALASPPTNKQNNLANKPSGGNGSVASSPADLAKKDDTSQVGQEITRDYDQDPAQDSTTGAQELKLSGNDKVEKFTSRDNTNYEKQEDEHASAEFERIANHGTHDTPIPTPSGTMAASRLKYTDIRKEEAEKKPLPVLPAVTPIDYSPTNPYPIAIFEEERIPGTGGDCRINILAPHSAELMRMLEEKWELLPSSRPGDWFTWNISLTFEWAMVAFQP
ncbi:hypothetical protein F4803DRAFT_564499 [Xylaria telfairii]|nr:hypothetical protein F4803DRAFT_564499 [Xylaria telfairii]